jgi:hypothetical protein
MNDAIDQAVHDRSGRGDESMAANVITRFVFE